MSNPAAKYRLLVVETNSDERLSLQRLLSEAGYNVSTADCAETALGYLDGGIDIVLTNIGTDRSGMYLLRHWKLKQPDTVFLIVSGYGGATIVADAMRSGAYRYILKPINVDELLVTLQQVVSSREQEREATASKSDKANDSLDQALGDAGLVGTSQAMRKTLEIIRRAAHNSTAVLILDEIGETRHRIAKAIHDQSSRRSGPFVTVDCLSQRPDEMGAELFGQKIHSMGSGRQAGAFQRAEGGTLFIDEIVELDAAMLIMLLRKLEQNAVASNTRRTSAMPVRVIAGASCEFSDVIADNTFRKDLYYDLNIITVEVPPLSQRPEDVPIVVDYVIQSLSRRVDTRAVSMSESAMDRLQQYRWPGGMRELSSYIERILVFAIKPQVELEDLPPFLNPDTTRRKPEASSTSTSSDENSFDHTLSTMALADIEYRAVAATLRRLRNNRAQAARSLGISVRTLQRKVRK